MDHTRPDRRVHRKVGGFLFDLFGAVGVTGLNLFSMIVAIVEAVVVLLIYNALTGRA